jgi:CRP/FNR family cyclic AMP-dependent transcriptional regulator
MESLSILKNVPLLQFLSDADLAQLSLSLRVQRLRKKHALFRKGDEGTALYIIRKGKVKIVLPSKVGEEVILTIFSEGDFLGEMSLLDEKPRSADAVSMEESEVYVLNRTDFLSFLQENENAIKCILSCLSERLRKTDDLLEDASFLSVSARLAKKLVELGREFGVKEKDVVRIGLRLTQQDMADLVGTTRESINKELRVLREKGLVSMESGYIRLLDLERLKRRVH